MNPSVLRSTDSVQGCLVYRQRGRTNWKNPNIPTSTRAPLLRLNTVCPYYTMFPLEFPLQRLTKAQKDAWVLDPFCGRGTTVFAARLLGLGCVGIDSNPIAAAIAAAKLSNTTAQAVIDLAHSILAQTKAPNKVPEGEFWQLCFHPQTLNELCILRERLLKQCISSEEVVLRALLLGILHGPLQKGESTYLSNQMPRTYATKPNAAVRFWKRQGLMTPPRVAVADAVARRALHTLAEIPPPTRGAVYFGDARRADSLLPRRRRFNWVVTSPPYFGMRTYRPDQWLRNWFLGDDDSVNYVQDGQLAHRTDQFIEELAIVWRAVATRCMPGARLIVRFGCLPSIPVDARDMLRTSLKLSKVRWRIYRWADAGSASNGKRQSEQFGSTTGTAAQEVDLYARLEV
ncbi:DNA modification methylase [Candidatus Bipolaricaulota bacterium]|nr:DNA modification methylase [Candidatus Bipolaricaulota bacterium]